MKLANILLAGVGGIVVGLALGLTASASFAAGASAPYSVNLNCSVVTDGIQDASQIEGFTLFDDVSGIAQTVSSDVLSQHGCEVKLVANTSGIYPEVAGSLFIVTKGMSYPFGYVLGAEAPVSCKEPASLSMPLHLAHSAPLQAVKACLGQ